MSRNTPLIERIEALDGQIPAARYTQLRRQDAALYRSLAESAGTLGITVKALLGLDNDVVTCRGNRIHPPLLGPKPMIVHREEKTYWVIYQLCDCGTARFKRLGRHVGGLSKPIKYVHPDDWNFGYEKGIVIPDLLKPILAYRSFVATIDVEEQLLMGTSAPRLRSVPASA